LSDELANGLIQQNELMGKRIESSAQVSQVLEDMASSTAPADDIRRRNEWDDKEKKDYIIRAFKELKASGVDFETAGIDNFGTQTTVESLTKILKNSPEEIENILNDLAEIGTDSESWQKKIEKHTKDTAVLLEQMKKPEELMTDILD
jgi:hypothetical protein